MCKPLSTIDEIMFVQTGLSGFHKRQGTFGKENSFMDKAWDPRVTFLAFRIGTDDCAPQPQDQA